jgi:hypothetical protein
MGLLAVNAALLPSPVSGFVLEIPTYNEDGFAKDTKVYDQPPADSEGVIEVPYQALVDNEKRTAKINPNTQEYADCLKEGEDITTEVMEGLKSDHPDWTQEEFDRLEKASHGEDIAFCIEFYDQNK